MRKTHQWEPSASLQSLSKRAEILSRIRAYFAEQNVLEVETPAISPSTVTDVHLEALTTLHTNPLSIVKTHLFLQTSPEFYMKRLLCAGFPSIYQISKCFRDDEVGRYHNPEFTLLEWYRLGFSMEQLIDDVDNILRLTLDTPICEKTSYSELFEEHLNIDIINAPDEQIVATCIEYGYENLVPEDFEAKLSVSERDNLLQLLFCEKIEFKIGKSRPIAVTHFPASQASLAKIDPMNPRLSLRFEFYYQGIELANGFEELSNSEEQKARFQVDNDVRARQGKAIKPIDEKFLSALDNGLPHCAGVALGIDRLIMLALDKKHISEVISFDFDSL
ncbi:elongation factor P--(R)-beta-lysine ligase [Glaciecola sp. MF2-115]|uniref:elongation factor P--(R)-beta-lysine ligase n=1 Tax=Glaciecola sp. MF2-115 TaxID=3384827 RepID=UPI0039A0AFCB